MCVWGKLLLSRNPQHSRREFCKIHSFLDLTVPQITDTKQIILWMSSSTCDEWWNKEMTNSRVIHGNVDLELSPDWEAKEGRGPLVEALPVPPGPTRRRAAGRQGDAAGRGGDPPLSSPGLDGGPLRGGRALHAWRQCRYPGKKWFLWQLTGNKLAVSNRPLTLGKNPPRSADEAPSSLPPGPSRPHLWSIPTHRGLPTIFTSLFTVWASPCSKVELRALGRGLLPVREEAEAGGLPVTESQPWVPRDAGTWRTGVKRLR